jgi:arylsulfatase B
MLSVLDRNIGTIVDALAARGLWDDTLMTFMSDNGGCTELTENAANNFPLRGGKYYAFEGGIRVTAFLSGGYLPTAARGTVSNELVHIADYYATLCVRAGLPLAECTSDPLAAAAGLPPIDSLDFWDSVVLGRGPSPRGEVPVDASTLLQRDGAALYKLFVGDQPGAGRTGSVFPNATGANPTDEVLHCGAAGCLFDVASDEGEFFDLASQQPARAAAMTARLAELRAGFYSNSDKGVDIDGCAAGGDCACWAAEHVWGGFLGPWQKE